ncbi:MAG: cation transporter [Chloroflexota bacterium]|nr:cation transporter [Chloroflexota bacterium]
MNRQINVALRLKLALAGTLVFVVVEAAAGISSNSLALLSDAGHNLTDAFALGFSLYALTLGQRPANHARTYGYHRAGILAALINATTLIGIALMIFYEAYHRLGNPPEVQEETIVIVAAIALLLNTLIALALRQPGARDLNVRSAFVHMAGDALSTLGVISAGIAITFTGWNVLDPLASILIGAVIVWSSWSILRETADILLEGTPRGVDMNAMVRDLMRIDGVRGVHDLHAWSINSSLRALSAHVLTNDVSISAGANIQREINQMLVQRYHIAHTALQLECEGCDPDTLYCELGDLPVATKISQTSTTR